MVVRKLIRLWCFYAKMDVLWLLKDIINVIAYYFMGIIQIMSTVTGVWFIADKFNGIGGIGKFDIIFMLGYSVCVSGLGSMIADFNIFHISRRIGRGQMDHTLIQPQPIWMSILTEGFMPVTNSGIMAAGISIIVYSLNNLEWVITPIWILVLILSIIVSTALYISYSFIWGSLAFYAPVAAEEICTSVGDLFNSIKNYPLHGLSYISKGVLISIVPIGLCSWYPSVFLNSGEIGSGFYYFLGIAGFYILLSIYLFNRGLKYYVQRGSSRYSDRGHRN